MSSVSVRSIRWKVLLAAFLNVLVATASVCVAADPSAALPPPPAFTSPDIKPTFADWLTGRPIAVAKKTWSTDPLLKPSFAAAPPDSLKGLAASIRAVQLDVPNRIKAAQYLGTVDCVAYPQAQDMLLATVQEDPAEEVRYEAVMSLRNMLTRGCSNTDSLCDCETCKARKKIIRKTEAHAKKGERALIKEAKGAARKQAFKAHFNREAERDRYDCCRGCANEKVMFVLARIAYEKDEQCCWIEPSERVRLAAAEAMTLFKVYPGNCLNQEMTQPLPQDDQSLNHEVRPYDETEVTPSAIPAPLPPQSKRSNPSAQPSVDGERVRAINVSYQADEAIQSPADLAVVPGLNGQCIVALKHGQFLNADGRYSSAFEGRRYDFSSLKAKNEFDRDPSRYAPAYGGIDPVLWLLERRIEEGNTMREFEGRLYLFVSLENADIFQANPNRFILRLTKSDRTTSRVDRQELPRCR